MHSDRAGQDLPPQEILPRRVVTAALSVAALAMTLGVSPGAAHASEGSVAGAGPASSVVGGLTTDAYLSPPGGGTTQPNLVPLDSASPSQGAPLTSATRESATAAAGVAAAPAPATRGNKTARLDRFSAADDGMSDGHIATRIDLLQSTKGVTRAIITYKGTPIPNQTLVVARFGVKSRGDCQVKYELRTIPGSGAQGGYLSQGVWKSSVKGSAKTSGRTVTATTVANAAIAKARWDCAEAWIAYQPVNEIVVGQFAYVQDLGGADLKIQGLSAPVLGERAGKWVRVRVEVRNGGDGEARNVRVTAKGKSMSIKKKTIKVGAINRRSTKYGVEFRVKLKGAKTRKLVLTAKATGGNVTKRTIKIARKPKPKRYKSLVGKYFWGFASTTLSSYTGWDTQTVWFVNKRYAHIGAPKNGKKPKCARTSKVCKRYKYNARTGQARIGKQRFKVTTAGFTAKLSAKDERRFYEPLTFPKKGKRLKVDLINQDWYGNCLLTCTSTTTHFSLDKKGRFVRSSWSIGSWPGLGSSWTIIPPDKRGTYRILANGRIELKFANKKVERRTIGIQHDVRGKPSPNGEGIVIGTTNYYWQD